MAKASPAEQLRLLDLQALDSRIRKLRSEARAAAGNPEIAAAQGRRDDARHAAAEADGAVSAAEREITKAEDDVAAVTARLERNQARLDSGTGTSKDLTALQHEIESLTRRRSDLEDVELEAMERLEELRGTADAARQVLDRAVGELAVLEQARDAELERIRGEEGTALQQRAELAGTFEPGLLALYEKTLDRHGVGAARLFHGSSEGSGMQLSPGDLADIRRAAEDDVVFCPDSGCILVRSAEWGS